MPRTPRFDFPGARHHVMNRGARRAPVFQTAEDRALFVDVLSELPSRFGLGVHAYVVMPNHYHLVVESHRGTLSRAMRHLGAVFTQRFNAQREWDGPVFKGRFRSRLVNDEPYWRMLAAYVHLNPVPSLAALPGDWDCTSYRAYVGLEPTPDWLTTSRYLESLGSPEQMRDFIEEHRLGKGTTPEGWDPENLWGQRAAVLSAPVQPTQTVAATIEHAMHDVVAVTGLAVETLTENPRGRRDNRARWLLAWWLVHRARLTHRQVSARMACAEGSVGKMLARLRQAKDDGDPLVTGWLEALAARVRAENSL